MIEFINENERPTLPCSGVFISTSIARLVYRSLCRNSKNTLSDADKDILDEFAFCLQTKLEVSDHFVFD